MVERDDPVGLYALGMAYLFGVNVETDRDRGYGLLERAASKGNPDAKALLAKMFLSQDYDGIDAAKATRYAREAAEQDVPDGQLIYGTALMEGAGGVQRDYAAAMEMFRKAAKAGVAEARNSMAYLYKNGLGVEKDEAKAFRLFKNAAEAGNSNAMYQTAVCYDAGIGCAPDELKAGVWYEKAAERGDALAMYRLGILYYQNEGYGEAFQWLSKSAADGVVEGMYATGLMYLNGVGVERDDDEGVKWLRMAAGQGMPEARKALDALHDVPETKDVDRSRHRSAVLSRSEAHGYTPVRRLGAVEPGPCTARREGTP